MQVGENSSKRTNRNRKSLSQTSLGVLIDKISNGKRTHGGTGRGRALGEKEQPGAIAYARH